MDYTTPSAARRTDRTTFEAAATQGESPLRREPQGLGMERGGRAIAA